MNTINETLGGDMEHTPMEFAQAYGLWEDDATVRAWLAALAELRPIFRKQDCSSRQAWLDSWSRIIDQTEAGRGESWTMDVDVLESFLRVEVGGA